MRSHLRDSSRRTPWSRQSTTPGSNRIGSTKPLNVHIPVTEIEEPMVEDVLRKARRVESDTREQEHLFARSR